MNRFILVGNLMEVCLIAQQMFYDYIQSIGKKVTIIIFTPAMLLSWKTLNARYRNTLAHKKDEVTEE